VVLPTVESYRASLPQGWASFPACVARTSLVAGLRDRDAFEGIAGMPDELARAIERAGHEGEWHPEVLHVASLLAVRDAHFPSGPGGEAKFLAWMEQLNRELMSVPGHAGAFAVTTIDELVRRFPSIWNDIHQGTTFQVDALEPTSAVLTLTFPRPLLLPLSLESTRRALAAGLAKAGAAQPVVALVIEDDGPLSRARFCGSWHHG
jgi:hypothetical protein